MRDNYYIFVVAHSIRGRLRRIRIPQYVVYVGLFFTLVGAVTVFAAVGSYTRMLLKTANYNRLRSDAELLKRKYLNLRSTMNHTEVQLASLQTLATEVSLAYGIKRAATDPELAVTTEEREQAYRSSAQQFQLLLRASFAPLTSRDQFLDNSAAGIIVSMDWPVQGRLTGSFGDRLDPFRGEGAFHAGMDISTQYGTPVRAATSGVVVSAQRESGYGLCVVMDHGRGLRTLYAHLSGFNVSPGQAVLGGEVIGYVGRSGRSTGPHLHYEVRVQSTPVNPSRFLTRSFSARGMGD